MEFNEVDEAGRYRVEVDIRVHTGTRAIRLGRAHLAAFGEKIGALITGGGLEIEGIRYQWADIWQRQDLLGLVVTSLAKLLDGVSEDDLVDLIVRTLAGAVRFRVAHFDAEAGDYVNPTDWIEVEDDEHAAEVLDDLFPSPAHMIRAYFEAAKMLRPTSRGVGTGAASKADATKPSRAATR